MSKDFSDCLKLLIESGKGLEINTSGSAPRPAPFPGSFLLKLYRDSGGEIVTIGSDAHSENDVGKGFFEAAALLRETGFRAYAAFQNRRPVFYDL
jgi:histidinol-phosphatase (PHP family)